MEKEREMKYYIGDVVKCEGIMCKVIGIAITKYNCMLRLYNKKNGTKLRHPRMVTFRQEKNSVRHCKAFTEIVGLMNLELMVTNPGSGKGYLVVMLESVSINSIGNIECIFNGDVSHGCITNSLLDGSYEIIHTERIQYDKMVK